MGMFDFLNVGTGAGNPNWVNPDTGAIARDPNSGFDLNALLTDPNFLQGMGNAGETLSKGGTFGEAFNPANLIRQIQAQKAGAGAVDKNQRLMTMLSEALSGKTPTNSTTNPTVTPANQEGPLSIKHEAGKPSVMTMSTPETIAAAKAADPKDAYGTNPSLESVQANRGSASSPFSEALFGAVGR